LAVIVSFLPMFYITGMMGPYMRPMALNVPVTMLMSMLVAFTITPWLAYHMLKSEYEAGGTEEAEQLDPDDPETIKQSRLYKFFYPLMAPLLHSRLVAWGFLLTIVALTVAAMGLAAVRSVPLKMLPFDNKNELLLVLDFDEGTTLERSDAAVRDFEAYLAGVPEVSDFTSYVGVASPMDFNGLVRHYYLRRGDNVAEVRIDMAGKKNRGLQSHAIGLRMRDDLQTIANRRHARMKLVETPPGPPVIASVVAEIYGQPDNRYDDLLLAADTVRERLMREPGVVDVDDVREAAERKLTFVADKEKAALNGVTTDDIAKTLQAALAGGTVGLVRSETERNPLRIELRLPVERRTSSADLARVAVKGEGGNLVSLAELGRWQTARVGQTIYHKDLQRVAYVFAETAGRPPADVVVDVQADRVRAKRNGNRESSGVQRSGIRENFGQSHGILPTSHDVAAESTESIGAGWLSRASPRPIHERTFFFNGSGIAWSLPDDFHVDFARRGRMEDHLGCVPRFGAGLRRGDDRHLHSAGGADRLIYDSTGGDAGDSADGAGGDARLLAAECRRGEARRRVSRSGLFHGHGHDRHDRPGGHRHPRFDHPGRLHSPLAAPRPLAVRRYHGKPRGPLTADFAHRQRGDVGRRADHHRPDFLGPGMVADLWPFRIDTLYFVRHSGRLLVTLRQYARPRPTASDHGR
ncbi:MAG TPA: efflux RND transporter permease subunit, partial [Pirellulales bacterium]|nr:efflux RND transporter permease subunit [Pirellulales bacterium]